MAFISLFPRFQGEFWASPKEVSRLKAAFEASKSSPEMQSYFSQELVIKDRRYPFEVQVFDFDDKTGLFIAKCQDEYGNSALTGFEHGDEIKFLKIYRNPGIHSTRPLTFRDDTNNFRFIDYYGIITSGIPEALGAYTRGREFAKDGFWNMKPVH